MLLRSSLIIVAFFALGVVFGMADGLPTSVDMGNASYMALCALMFCVGLGVGHDSLALKKFLRLDPLLLLLPLMTIVGTLAGCAVVSLLLPHRTLTQCLAVGAGFGYYSLSSIFITRYIGPELGIVALLANILREMITLLGAPLMVRYWGKLAPISVGGATSMDTTLPVITRYSGQELVIVSVFHGFIVDFTVPFLVTFFCSIQ